MLSAEQHDVILRRLKDAEAAIETSRPKRPLTAFDIFASSLKQQYGFTESSVNYQKVMHVVNQAWETLPPPERTPFEIQAQHDMQRYQEEEKIHEQMQVHYNQLKTLAQSAGILQLPNMVPQTGPPAPNQQQRPGFQQYGMNRPPPNQPPMYQGQQQQGHGMRPPPHGQPHQQQQHQMPPPHSRPASVFTPGQPQGPPQNAYRQQQPPQYGHPPPHHHHYQQQHYEPGPMPMAEGPRYPPQHHMEGPGFKPPVWPSNQHIAKLPPNTMPHPGAPSKSQAGGRPSQKQQLPQHIGVTCQGVNGTMIIADQRIICQCSDCAGASIHQRTMSCLQFEAHSGAGNVRRWRTSIMVRPGGAIDVPVTFPATTGGGVPLGKWLDQHGIDATKSANKPVPGIMSGVSSDAVVKAVVEKAQPPPERNQYNKREREAAAQARREAAYGQYGASDFVYDDIEETRPRKQVAYTPAHASAGNRNGFKRPASRATRQSKEQSGSLERAPSASTATAKPQTTPWREVLDHTFRSINVRWSGERCCVCDADTDTDYDQLITCDMCGITVHQSCYGVSEVPGVEDMWLCRACELREEGKPPPQCCLCPVAGGALKPTTISGLWCHAACLQWIPEVSVEDPNAMEPVTGIRSIQKERWELQCVVCKRRMGAKIQCVSCYTSYHPLCARIAGYKMEIIDQGDEDDSPVDLTSYCARHCLPKPQLSGVRRVEESEEEGDLPELPDVPKLWNGQPFYLAPAAPLPHNTSGCARAEPLLNWTRSMHGTGTGAATTAGFWLPEQPSEEPEEYNITGKKASTRGRTGSLGTKQEPATTAAAAVTAPAASAPVVEKEPEPDITKPVELLPLPEGIPEEVPVVCNNKHALVRVRTQRVVYNGEDMAPSRFEALCGKGDSKKWKMTLLRSDEEGKPLECIQEWLDGHNLDRKALDALAKNARLHKAWVVHQAGGKIDEEEEEEDNSEETETEVEVDADPSGKAVKSDPKEVVQGIEVKDEAAGAMSNADAMVVDLTETPSPPDDDADDHAAIPLVVKEEEDAGKEAAQPVEQQPADPVSLAQQVDTDLPSDIVPMEVEGGDAQEGGKAAKAPAPASEPNQDPSKPQDASMEDSAQLTQEQHLHQLQEEGKAPAGAGSLTTRDTSSGPGPGTTGAAPGGEASSAVVATDLAKTAAGVDIYTAMVMAAAAAEKQCQEEEDVAQQGGPVLSTDLSPVPENIFDWIPKVVPPHSVWDSINKSFAPKLGSEEASLSSAALQKRLLARNPYLPQGQGGSKRDPRQAAGIKGPSPPPSYEIPEEVAHDLEVVACDVAALRQKSSTVGERPTPKLKRLDILQAETLPIPQLGGKSGNTLLGTWCRVWWPEDEEWYVGKIQEYDNGRGQFKVWYETDGQDEWIDLKQEDRNGRLQLLVGDDRNVWDACPPAPAGHVPPVTSLPPSPRKQAQHQEMDQEPAGEGLMLPPSPEVIKGPAEGQAAVGRKIRVKWEADGCYYTGVVRTYRQEENRHLVVFDDGHADWIDTAQPSIEWLPTTVPQSGLAALGGLKSLPPGIPATIDVVCGNLRGSFDLLKSIVTIHQTRQELSPSEFERLGGRTAAKKWKTSLRMDEGNGVPGITMEAWLIKVGIDQARAPKPRGERWSGGKEGGGGGADGGGQVRRRQAVRRNGGQTLSPGSIAHSEGGKKGRGTHKDGCGCVVCKQARKNGRVAAAAAGKAAAASAKAAALPEQQFSRYRTGKRAFVEALPQLIGTGGHPHKIHEIPLSRCWAPDDWAAHRVRRNLLDNMRAVGDNGPLPVQPPVVLSAGVNAVLPNNLAAKISLGYGAAGTYRALTVRDKLELCRMTEHERVVFGKSGIHGWGLFAKVPMKQDTMVVEFRGDVARRSVADFREGKYQAQGADCYIFNLDDDVVIDATKTGTIARFTNHSCEPSMYTKILNVDGELRLAFFARTDIQPGQELTYNYRFKAEEGEERIPCTCGAPNCSGFLN